MTLIQLNAALAATALLRGCATTGLAVEDPHPDVSREIWNVASRHDTAYRSGGMAGVAQQHLAVAKQQFIVLDTSEAPLQAQATRARATQVLAYSNSVAQAREAECTQQAAK
jgi:hypothetical protein